MEARNWDGFSRQCAFFDSQTVEDNVMFPSKMFTQNTYEEMLDRVNFVLKRVNLRKFKS